MVRSSGLDLRDVSHSRSLIRYSSRSIDIDTYDRQHDRLREELTLAQMERHAGELEEMDVEGILVVGTGTTLPVFNYLNPISDAEKNWWT